LIINIFCIILNPYTDFSSIVKKNIMNTKLDKIFTEISAGELVDKITILQIKKEKIKNADKLKEIEKELSSLDQTYKKYIPNSSIITKLFGELKNINQKLWDIEDGKRAAEKNNNFNDEFIQLARNVYKFNDERAKIKLAINNNLGSNIKEVKSYE
jgi:hypothetical protein